MTAKTFLTPLSFLYRIITDSRNWLYEKEFLQIKDLETKTVSIGNITVGGTGKTPLVAKVAEILSAHGEKVAILTRGYGREDESKEVFVSDGEKILTDFQKGGDEPLELAEKLLGKSAVISSANRFSAGMSAKKELKVSAFVLDDAFQHRQLKRTLDLVCVDASKPFGNYRLLPAGILRESLKNLKRASAVVITRANLSESLEKLQDEIKSFNSECPIFVTRNKFVDLSAEVLRKNVLAFCALGNPENFFDQLRNEKIKLVSTKSFPDHYRYTQKDIDELEALVKLHQANFLLTTKKDAVKLKNLKFSTAWQSLESKLIFDDEQSFTDFLRGKLCLKTTNL